VSSTSFLALVCQLLLLWVFVHLILLEPVLVTGRPCFHLFFFPLLLACRSAMSLLAPPKSQPAVVIVQVLFNLGLWTIFLSPLPAAHCLHLQWGLLSALDASATGSSSSHPVPRVKRSGVFTPLAFLSFSLRSFTSSCLPHSCWRDFQAGGLAEAVEQAGLSPAPGSTAAGAQLHSSSWVSLH